MCAGLAAGQPRLPVAVDEHVIRTRVRASYRASHQWQGQIEVTLCSCRPGSTRVLPSPGASCIPTRQRPQLAARELVPPSAPSQCASCHRHGLPYLFLSVHQRPLEHTPPSLLGPGQPALLHGVNVLGWVQARRRQRGDQNRRTQRGCRACYIPSALRGPLAAFSPAGLSACDGWGRLHVVSLHLFPVPGTLSWQRGALPSPFPFSLGSCSR
jgi:hypothetical protein